MTERLAETRRRIENVHQLEAVVTAMRAIAASRAQQARSLLPGLHSYTSVIAHAIGQALALLPEGHNRAGSRAHRAVTILFCAEAGFAGAFSDRVLDVLGTDAAMHDLFLVGTRGVALAGERRIPLAWHVAMVPHASLIPGLAGRIADALYDWLSDSVGPRVDVLVPTWSAASGVAVDRRSLLPFDFRHFSVPAPGKLPPLITLPPPVLLARLAEEYVFAELCESALTAFAAENDARIAAMLAAKANLEHMQSDLKALERQIRQEEITAEVVELASGAGSRR
jgi:F-type H+-transporting ATPase subunit gamma